MKRLREMGDYIYLLQKSAPYATGSDSTGRHFTYALPTDSNLVRVRQYFRLDSIAGNGDEISKMKRIMLWLHDNIRHDGGGGIPQVPRNAIALYEACKKQERGLNCRGLAIMLSEMYMAMGWPSRFLTCESKMYGTDHDCHVINMVWSSELGKWVWMDPTFNAFVTDENGLLLHPGEVRQRICRRTAAHSERRRQLEQPSEADEGGVSRLVHGEEPLHNECLYRQRIRYGGQHQGRICHACPLRIQRSRPQLRQR